MLARNAARLRLQGRRTDKMRPYPASSAHQPNDADTDGGGNQAGDPQHTFRHRQNLAGELAGEIGKAAIDDALDDEDEAHGGPEILHRAYCPVAGWAGADAAAFGAEPEAAMPCESRKKRRNSEFGDKSIVVPVLSRAVP